MTNDSTGDDELAPVPDWVMVLSEGETLKIGEAISVCVKRVDGSQIRLGVGAPREVSIFREEVYSRRGPALSRDR